MSARKRLPKLCRHKASGQGYVTDPRVGQEVYLGLWGAPETVTAYDRWCRDYLAAGGKAEPPPAPRPPARVSLGQLFERHLDFAEREYVKHGAETSEVRNFRMAARAVLAVCDPGGAAEDFGTADFKRVRESVAARLSRGSVNGLMSRVRRVWAWAVEEQLLPAPCWHALLSVRRARKGRGGKERPAVVPVAWGVVQATLPRLREAHRAVVLLGWHGAMRPGEVVRMLAGEVDTSREPWLYRPGSWKTDRYEGLRPREVFLGPRARDVLRPWLARCRRPEDPVFRGRFPGTHLSATTVRDAVRLACMEEPEIEHWSANRLRHAQATEVRKRYGLEAAQVILGHAKADVSQVYAQRDRELAARVIEDLG